MGMEAPKLAAVKPYPLTFTPLVLEKVWGGRRLARLGKAGASADRLIGESWEIADLVSTSASGAGGSAMRSTVAAGALKGRSIGDALREIGSINPFPLLIKYLDAAENLSVQVHPSPDAVQRDRSAHLKTESWYVVDAEPGANLYIGLRPGVGRREFERALAAADRDAAAVVGLLQRIEAVPGRCYTLPSGIIHALGAGVLVAEVQTPSDTTYRLFDWGRKGRELHIEQGLASAFAVDGRPTVAAATVSGPLAEGELCARLAETAFYTIDEVRPQDGDEVTVGFPCRCAGKRGGGEEEGFVLMVVAGRGELAAAENGFAPVMLEAGVTVFVPRVGGCEREAVLRGSAGLRVLRVGIRGGQIA